MATASEQSKINNLKTAQKKLETDIEAILKRQVELQKKGSDLDAIEIDNLNKKQKQITKNLELQLKGEDAILDTENSILESLAQQESSISSISGIYSNLQKSEKTRLGSINKTTSLSLSQVTAVQEMSSISVQIAELNKDQVIQNSLLTEQYNTQSSILSNTSGMNAEAIAEAAKQKIILDESLGIARKHSNLTKKQKQYLEDQIDVYDKMKKAVGGVLDTASLLWSTAGGKLGGALIGAGFLMEKLGHTAHKTGTFFTEMTLSATGLSFIFSDATEVATGLAKELGGIEHATFGAQLQTNLLANNLNIGAGEAASLMGSFSRMSGNSTDIAASTIQATKNLAKQHGVIPAQVMADMAGSTKAFADYGKEGGKNIAEAAIYAAKLGVTMDSLTTVTDSLLDFETSMTAELELGAMLGKSINLSKARQLAYDGKIGASVKEALSQMGGVSAFNKMDVFQKREAAAALGLSTDEMFKMVSNMDKLNDDGTIQLTTAQGIGKKFDYISETMKGIATGPGGDFLKMLGGGAIAMGQMGFDVKGILGNMLKWPISKVQGMLGKISGGETVTSKAGEMVADKAGKMWGTDSPQGKMITTAKESMAEKLKTAGGDKVDDVTGSITDKIEDQVKGTTETETKVKGKSGDGLKGLAEGLTAMGTGKVAIGALNLIPTAVGMIMMLPALPGLAILSLLGAPAGLGLTGLAKGIEFMGTKKVTIGALNIGLLGISLGIMGYAMGQFAKNADGILPAVGALVAFGIATAIIGANSWLMFLGAAAIAAIGLSLFVLGAGIQSTVAGLSAMTTIGSTISSLTGQIGGITALSVAFMGLASSLGVLGIASLLAMPALMGLSMAGTGISVVSNLFNPKEKSAETSENTSLNKEAISTYETEMVQLTKDLIAAVKQNRDVYLDKEKVTSIVKKTSEKQTSNSSFGLAGA